MQPHHVSVYRYGGEEFAVIFGPSRSLPHFHCLTHGAPPLKDAHGGKKICTSRSARVWVNGISNRWNNL